MEQATNSNSKVTTMTSRKRARKGSCALCTTCPCNNNGASNSCTEISSFARSDAAIEKALIRRVQKLEKTCEIDESRMEIARRKLKQHRREMWKKRESNIKAKRPNPPTGSETQFSFLPEAEEMLGGETYECSQVLPPEIVRNAQKVIFPDTPCVQVTLTQLMGFSAKRRPLDRGDTSETHGVEAISDQDSHNGIVEDASIGKKENYVCQPDCGYKEYSRGVEFEGDITRLEWKSNSTMSTSRTFSLWRTASKPQLTTEMEELSTLSQVSSDNPGQLGCPWDSLFHDDDNADGSKRSNRNGIEELVGLFDDDSPVIEGADGKHAQDQVHLSDLSQVAHDKATELIISLEQNPSRRKLLERACPNWKENLAFCMKQTKDDVRLALEQVRRKRRQRIELKCKILEAWERHDAVLCFFEQALNTSLTRSLPPEATDENHCEADRDWFENHLINEVGEGGFDSLTGCRNEDDHDNNSTDQDQRVFSY